jgi:murein DD-endopeptidase MepM/ murein hydrolase activator NlpD
MAKQAKKVSKWKYRYRFTIFNDYTLQEVWQVRFSKLNVFILVGLLILFLITATTVLIAFTNLREFIPGYPDGNMRRNIIMNAYLLDSLENELRIRDQYFENLSSIISGEEPHNYTIEQDTNIELAEISFTTSLEDSLLRHQIEVEEQYNLSVSTEDIARDEISSIHFFTPMKGIVTNSFNAIENHFGTDVVGSPNSVVSATLDGTVILASWTVETGYVMQIQHENDLVSVYKHNAELLKKVGSVVRAGESIAIIGNSGELFTSGPHLHFELWHQGKALDPQKYLVF